VQTVLSGRGGPYWSTIHGCTRRAAVKFFSQVLPVESSSGVQSAFLTRLKPADDTSKRALRQNGHLSGCFLARSFGLACPLIRFGEWLGCSSLAGSLL